MSFITFKINNRLYQEKHYDINKKTDGRNKEKNGSMPDKSRDKVKKDRNHFVI